MAHDWMAPLECQFRSECGSIYPRERIQKRSALASLRGVMRVEVLNNAGLRAGWDLRAKGFAHFIDFGFPSGRRQRWLHRDIARCVASVAVCGGVLTAHARN